jgi:hypothetical protein
MHRGVPGAVDRRRDDRIDVVHSGGELPRRVEDVRERGLERLARRIGPCVGRRSRDAARLPRRAPSRRLGLRLRRERESRVTHVDRPLAHVRRQLVPAAAARALRNRSPPTSETPTSNTGSVMDVGAIAGEPRGPERLVGEGLIQAGSAADVEGRHDAREDSGRGLQSRAQTTARSFRADRRRGRRRSRSAPRQ